MTVDLGFSGTATLTGDYTRSGTQIAIAAGRGRLVLAELPVLGLAVGAVVTALIYVFHANLFGP